MKHAQLKSYKPVTNSLSEGQVLSRPYKYEEAKLIVKEMAENISLSLVKKDLITSKIVLEIIYDVSNLDKSYENNYVGEYDYDGYGRKVPKHAHGTINLEHKTASTEMIVRGTAKLFDRIVNKNLLIRKIYVTVAEVTSEEEYKNILLYEQMNMFIDYQELENKKNKEQSEKQLQKAVIGIKEKFGKNAVLKGMNFVEGATAIERNGQIGGHKG